jgi:hypothetical protein
MPILVENIEGVSWHAPTYCNYTPLLYPEPKDGSISPHGQLPGEVIVQGLETSHLLFWLSPSRRARARAAYRSAGRYELAKPYTLS